MNTTNSDKAQDIIIPIAANESEMSPQELEAYYNPPSAVIGGLEHPVHAKSTWRTVVWECGTLDGYWEWVAAEIHDSDIHGEDNSFGPG